MKIWEKRLFLSFSIFYPFFGLFACLNITNIQEPPEISFVSQPVRPILQKSADHLRTSAGDSPGVNNWRSNLAHNARKTDRAILLRPESKRPLKSRIGRLYSTVKTERIFVSVRALLPRSVPAAHEKARQKEPKTVIYNHSTTTPGSRQLWLLIKHAKNGLKIRQL